MAAAVAISAALAGGCGVTDASSISAAQTSAACGDLVSSVLGGIVKRIYTQAASGANVKSSVKRLARSRRLPVAVLADDPAATRAALKPLLKHQIRRIIVKRGSHVLADLGRASAVAPTHGTIHDRAGHVVGTYILAVSEAHAIRSVASALTGAAVNIRRAAAAPVNPPGLKTVSFAATAFPSGALRVYVTIPASESTPCGASPAQAVADTVGMVGQRLFQTEMRGAAVQRVLRHVAGDARFRKAVIDDDPAALRTAIVRFFRTRSLHVVRIRATTAAGKLVNDVGGPHVLAPASRTLRSPSGAVLGRVTLSVQDDTGYIKLMHRFTGAAVQLQTVAGRVPGSTLRPGPPSLPAQGQVAYRGRTYEVSGFQASAFPDGPLDIWLLLPLPAA